MVRALIPRTSLLPRLWDGVDDRLEKMVERFFGAPMMEWAGESAKWFAPRIDFTETDKSYEVVVDLPGVKPEDFKVEVRDGALWISGEKKEEHTEENKTLHRIERHYGEFRRVIPLPEAVLGDEVSAEYEAGVLTVHVPKAPEVTPKRVAVTVKKS